MKTSSSTFNVSAVRMDAVSSGQVLHFGRFESGHNAFAEGDTVTQEIDTEKRLLYSRLHTAGHVLGAATRKLLEDKIEGFDELKASHFPDAASCEFAGSIEGKWKEAIQKKVDEYVDADLPVEIEWWSEDDFKANGLERLILRTRMWLREKSLGWSRLWVRILILVVVRMLIVHKLVGRRR